MQLEDIKGLGAKRIAKLHESGIYDPLDILLMFPSAYFDRNKVINWKEISPGTEVIFEAEINSPPVMRHVRKGLSYVKCEFNSFGTKVVCTWFNQSYIYRRLSVGEKVIISGKLKKITTFAEISAPKIIPSRAGNIVPIYKLPEGLNQKLMSDAVAALLTEINIQGYVTDETANKAGIIPLRKAIYEAHFPTGIETAKTAVRSAATESLAYTLSMYRLLKCNTEKRRKFYGEHISQLNDAFTDLPFQLTDDQKNAINKIVGHMCSDKRMNVLLQGDVGSGKTIVAFLAAYYAALGGYQTAIMAPTEILAKQHWKKAIDFFGSKGLKVVCLTGSMPAKDKAVVLESIANGSASIVVGTHALTGKNVCFNNLSLTITDEQHRFGVCQRGSLENKTDFADNIVMSATPIPRTLALSIYGQLETINLRQKPQKNYSIMTAIVPNHKINDMYGYIEKRAEVGEKTYIVCPRIESEDENSAVSTYKKLKSGALKNTKIALLHGKLSAAEKEMVMNDFAFGETAVLVCTTVVEVGMDIPDATTMVIFGADKMGLSQLHQLRGRIGRRGQKSYCFIAETSDTTGRLKKLCTCFDGFELAEYDFNSRGAGDFLGTRQHGRAETFAGIKIDAEILRNAEKLSTQLLSDPEISHALIKKADGKEEFIRSLSLN